jgi:hypothetical protein
MHDLTVAREHCIIDALMASLRKLRCSTTGTTAVVKAVLPLRPRRDEDPQ